MIDTVIFDLDGLLIDSEQGYFRIYHDLFRKHGRDFTLEDYLAHYCGRTSVKNGELLTEDLHLDCDPKETADYLIREDQRNIDQGVLAKKGARELLDYLKENHYKTVLATSSLPKRAIQALTYNHMEKDFDAMVFGTDVTHPKPAPDVFLLAAERVHSDPSVCLVLEDSSLGIEAAYRAGIKVICIPDLYTPEEEYRKKTEAILPSLEDVIEYLKQA